MDSSGHPPTSAAPFRGVWTQTALRFTALVLMIGLVLLPRPARAGYQVATGVTNGLGAGRNPFDKANQRKVTRDHLGRWLVVYSRVSPGTGRNEVMLARTRDYNPLNNQPDVNEWQSVCLFGQGGVVLDNATNNYHYPSLDGSENRQRLSIVVLDATANDVLHTQTTNLANWNLSSAWTQAGGGTSPRHDTVNASVYSTAAPSLALDTNGRPHVVYVRANGSSRPSVYYRTWQGSWGPEIEISDVSAAGTAFPTDLDPAIDFGGGGYLYVAYRDDSNVGDATPKTDRYRSVRNSVAGSYAAFEAPATVITAGANNDQGQPPSLAAQGTEVWVVGGFGGTGTQWAWFNYSSDNGASWAQGAAGSNFECSASFDVINPVVGTNPAGTDHRVAAMRDSTNNRLYRYHWTGTTWVDNTCATHTQYVLGFNGSASADRNNVTIEKHKPSTNSNMIYCFYNSFDDTPNTPPPPADSITCDLMGPLTSTSSPTYRSVGTRADDVGNATVTRDQPTVTGVGTSWKANNRGRGDRFTINVLGTDYHYVVASVQSDTQLTLDRTDRSALGHVREHGGAPVHDPAGLGGLHLFRGTPAPTSRSRARAWWPTTGARSGSPTRTTVFKHSTEGPGGTPLGRGAPILSIDGSTTDVDATRSP